MANRGIRGLRAAAPLALVLTVSMAACGAEDSGSEQAGEQVTEDGTAQSQTETEATAEEGSPAAGSPGITSTGLEVTADGDGPVGLTAPGYSGESAPYSGRLIVGPGGCLSVVDNSRPELVVFPDDAEFVLRGDRPSVTTEALGTLRVGEPVEFTAGQVPLAEATGIPDRCTGGAAEIVRAAVG